MRGVCTVDGCSGPRYGQGLCNKHWQRLRKTGRLDSDYDRDPAAKRAFLVAAGSHEGCVDWPWTVNSSGYGMYLKRPATHWALELVGRPWHPPLGHYVLHSCDRKVCCNPNHLRWGTPLANSHDAKTRGLTARGERQGRAKLTEADVIAIRTQYANKQGTLRSLAAQYGVGFSSIHGVVHRRLWMYVP